MGFVLLCERSLLDIKRMGCVDMCLFGWHWLDTLGSDRGFGMSIANILLFFVLEEGRLLNAL